jgi:hypothetical protein
VAIDVEGALDAGCFEVEVDEQGAGLLPVGDVVGEGVEHGGG